MNLINRITKHLVAYVNSRTQFTKKALLLALGLCAAFLSLRLILAPGTNGRWTQPDLMIQPPLQPLQDSTHSQQLNKTDSL